MNRRGVLKFLGLSSVAAPALAKAGVDTDLAHGRAFEYPMEFSDLPESISELAKESWKPPSIEGYSDFRRHIDKGLNPLDLAKRIYRAEQEKAHYTSETYRRRRTMEDRAYLHRIDPDLAAYKSFSAVALCRMQAERNFERVKEHSADYWDDVIKALKKGFIGLNEVDKAMGAPDEIAPPPPRTRPWP